MTVPRLLVCALVAVLMAGPSTAQSPANPLQPRSAAPATEPAPAAKPKRPRSEAQLRNDGRLRACGAEWRADKPKLTAAGYTWIKFSGECRKRLAAQGR